MPRFMRIMLLLATLGLLVGPMGAAQAQTEGEITGTVVAGTAASCAPTPPDPAALSHVRCVGGVFGGAGVAVAATRPLPNPTPIVCSGDVGNIGFDTRETVAEGRGRIPLITVADVGGDPACDLGLQGAFHRVGTVAIGRLELTLGGHTYCARFDATAVPTGTGLTVVTAAVEGRATSPCATADPAHGRAPNDDVDPLHGDTCYLPPEDAQPQCNPV